MVGSNNPNYVVQKNKIAIQNYNENLILLNYT